MSKRLAKVYFAVVAIMARKYIASWQAELLELASGIEHIRLMVAMWSAMRCAGVSSTEVDEQVGGCGCMSVRTLAAF